MRRPTTGPTVLVYNAFAMTIAAGYPETAR